MLPVKRLIGQERCCHMLPPHLGLWVKQEGQTIREGDNTRIKTTQQCCGVHYKAHSDSYRHKPSYVQCRGTETSQEVSHVFLSLCYPVFSGGGSAQDIFPGEDGPVSVAEGLGHFSA